MKKLFALCLLTSFLLQADVPQQEGPTAQDCGAAFYQAAAGCPVLDGEVFEQCLKCRSAVKNLQLALAEAIKHDDENTAESLQEHIDQEQQNFVQRHPWWSMGGTLTAGALAGLLLTALRIACISVDEGSFTEALNWIITGKD